MQVPVYSLSHYEFLPASLPDSELGYKSNIVPVQDANPLLVFYSTPVKQLQSCFAVEQCTAIFMKPSSLLVDPSIP